MFCVLKARLVKVMLGIPAEKGNNLSTFLLKTNKQRPNLGDSGNSRYSCPDSVHSPETPDPPVHQRVKSNSA